MRVVSSQSLPGAMEHSMFDDTYAYYCYLRDQEDLRFTTIGVGENRITSGGGAHSDEKYRNLPRELKRIYEEKANYLTNDEILFVQIIIAPLFELDAFAKAMESDSSKDVLIDAHLNSKFEMPDTNNNIEIGELHLKYPGYLLNLGNLDDDSIEKYRNYRLFDIDPTQTDIQLRVEDVSSVQLAKGKWEITIDFTLKNVGSDDITISNIEIFCNYRDVSAAALTIGARDGIDLRRYGSLKDEGKYYDLSPKEDQKATMKLCINRWWGVRQNSIERCIRALFSMSIDYHVTLERKEYVLKRTLPTVFNFEFNASTGKDGVALCFYEGNMDSFYRKHRGRDEQLRILTSISDFINIVKCKAIVLWEAVLNENAQSVSALGQDGSRVRIFISYSRGDHVFANRLKDALERKGIAVWIDTKEILPGDSIIQEIRKGIDGAHYVCALISENSVRSEWVQNELDTAMSVQLEQRKVKVLPILLNRNVDLPGFLRGRLYVDFSTKGLFDEGVELIMRRIEKDTKFGNAYGE